MKVRSGFVSNSSSSSFTCDVCGRSETVWDASLQDIDMIQCENYHIICMDELLEDINGDEDKNEDGEILSKFCPICQLTILSERDSAEYLLKRTSIPRDEAFAEVKKVNKRRKKLYDNEYVLYACNKAKIDMNTLLPSIKTEFGTYEKFRDYLDIE